MAYGESNGHVTDVDLKGQIRDHSTLPNILKTAGDAI